MTPKKRPDTTEADPDDDQLYSEACAESPAKRMREDAGKSKEDGTSSAASAPSKLPSRGLRTLFNPSFTDELLEAPDP